MVRFVLVLTIRWLHWDMGSRLRRWDNGRVKFIYGVGITSAYAKMGTLGGH